jgi:DNA-binding IclR family transcriptional regulator
MYDRNLVRSVDRAASLLIALGEMDGEAGVIELARRLDLHKSTASRLLSTLQKSGLVEQSDGSSKYRLGLAVVRLGRHAERALDLRAIAIAELESLARAVHETISLDILEDDSVLTIAYSDASGTRRDRTGRNAPLHATAPGKILLANQPEREVIRLSKTMFIPYTSHTIVRVDLLLEELARVRKRGFSTAFGEHDPAVNAIAVPVYDQRAAVVAALEVRGVGTRITPSRVPELVDRARAAAAVITDRIGGVSATLAAMPPIAAADRAEAGAAGTAVAAG